MAHRKLQQEIDRVFKKINEGLEIFNTYHERHEIASNSTQKDKLENDLKREIKKLQKLREQIKVWQTSSDVKDKDKLLEYRRLVEVAMEKYKVVEKGSKVKAYSNSSLKAAAELDPEEKEKQDTINFIQESIDDLESQFDSVEVELDKLLSKKSKKAQAQNEAKKEELKELQTKYRWHQQNLELALRLLENGELQIEDINEIKEDIIYFLENNRDPNFIDNEYVYESLDLDSNEVIQSEIVSSFIATEKEPTPEPAPPTSSASHRSKKEDMIHQLSSAEEQPTKIDSVVSTPLKQKKYTALNTSNATLNTPPSSSQPGTPTVIGSNFTTNGNTLKPAVTPVKPATEMKWSALAAGVNDKKETLSSPVIQHVSSTEHSQPTLSQVPQPLVPQSQPLHQPAQQQEEQQLQLQQQQPLPQQQQLHLQQVHQQQIHQQRTLPIEKNDDIAPQVSAASTPRIDETRYLNDSKLVNLPPGIQDIILSFYSNRVNGNFATNSPSTSTSQSTTPIPTSLKLNGICSSYSHKSKISNIADYLTPPRYFLGNPGVSRLVGSKLTQNELSVEHSKSLINWSRIRQLLKFDDEQDLQSNEIILNGLDVGTLFYGFYYALTPFENSLIGQELTRRNWVIDHSKLNWYLKKVNINGMITSQPITKSNEGFEIGNFNKFDGVNWNLVELSNYKLDHHLLF